MPKSSTHLQIAAPVNDVFKAISDVESFVDRSNAITRVEFLSDKRSGVGTKFRETRVMGKKEATAVLEIIECVENERIRFVSDEGGTVWDTVFRVSPSQTGTRLDLEMDAKPHKLLAKIVTPLMIGMIGKFVKKDIEELKDWCEQSTSASRLATD